MIIKKVNFLLCAISLLFQVSIFGADLGHDQEQDKLAKAALELFMKNMSHFSINTDKNINELQKYIAGLNLTQDKLDGINFVLKELFGSTNKGWWYNFRAKNVLATLWFFAANFNKQGGYQNKQEKNPNASEMLKHDIVDAILRCKLIGYGGLPFVACFTGKSQTFLSKIQGYMPGIILDPTETIKEKAKTSFTLFFKHEDQKILFASEKRSDWIAAANLWIKDNTMNIDPKHQALYKQLFLEELTAFMDNQEMPSLEEEEKEEKAAEQPIIPAQPEAQPQVTSTQQPSQPTAQSASQIFVQPKAVQALQTRNFKNITNTLAKQAKMLQQKKQVQKIKATVNKVNINIRNAQGQTPLMVNPSIAPVLLVLNKNKARSVVNAKDKEGKTVLQYLIASPYNGQVYIYRILKNAGVQVKPNDIKAVQRKLRNKPKIRNQIIKILRKK